MNFAMFNCPWNKQYDLLGWLITLGAKVVFNRSFTWTRRTNINKASQEGTSTRARLNAALPRLNLPFYSLFILFSNLPPRLMRQGHTGGGRVSFVCSRSADCSVMKWLSIKGRPRGQGRSPGSDSLPDTGVRAGWWLHSWSTVCVKSRGFRKVWI